MTAKRHALKLVQWFAALLLLGMASGAFAFGTTARFVILTNQDSEFSTSGSWAFAFPPSTYDPNINPTFYGEFWRTISGTGGAETAVARWDFGTLAVSPGTYGFDAFIPDTSANSGTAVVYRIESAPWGLFTGCGAYTTFVTFTGVNADTHEGRWVPIGTADLVPFTCYRLVLSNQGNAGAVIQANAVRAERLFESSATITDMPRIASQLTAGTTFVTSTSNAAPNIITTLTVTCPQSGNVLVTGSGESTAQTNVAGNNFNGLAYSISMNSTATDNSNVVQSSSLAVFNGDANRDFLNVQRVDSCTAGQSITYRLTAYRAQAATGPASFIWNGRLVAQYIPITF